MVLSDYPHTGAGTDAPRNDTFRLLRVRGAQIRDLCRLKLGQCRFTAQRSGVKCDKIKTETWTRRNTHSRTALAESVVLNLPNVFTYSRVLLYTLRSCEKAYMREASGTHAVSGGSFSLFSNKYFTSEMSRQPALLNSAHSRLDIMKGYKITSHT